MIENRNFIEKIKSNFFMNTDKVEFDLILEKLIPISIEEEEIIDNCAEIINEIKTILMTGPIWEFNPTNAEFYDTEMFEINEEKLKQFIKDESVIEVQNLDVNNNFVQISLPVTLLIGNAKHLADDLIMKSDYCNIITLIGEINL